MNCLVDNALGLLFRRLYFLLLIILIIDWIALIVDPALYSEIIFLTVSVVAKFPAAWVDQQKVSTSVKRDEH